MANDANIVEAIKGALNGTPRKHLEIWRSVSSRYPDTKYAHFDGIMGKLEIDEVILLTGCRGPNTYRLAK